MQLTVEDMAYELAEREVLFTPWQHIRDYCGGSLSQYAKEVHRAYTELPEHIIIERYNQMTGEQDNG